MAQQIVTLNIIGKLMRDFQLANDMLNDFGIGNTFDIGTSRQMKFPYMWVTPQPSSVINLNRTTLPIFNFSIIFADQLNDSPNVLDRNGEESNNGLEILSDTFQYAQDFITYVLTNWSQYGLLIDDETISISPTYDATDDKVNGWVLDIQFKAKYVNCELP